MVRRDLDMTTNRRNPLHKEPGVINQDLILSSLKKLSPKGAESKLISDAVIDPQRAEALVIEFYSISQIANISHMVNLRKLILSNNVISKIERLETLVNLEELDLSFNTIKKIEGLDGLKNLRVLNLHRNLITVVENLENVLRLELFVCSTNGIAQFENIYHLRRLVRLRALNLEGNPIQDKPEYRNMILAILPDLLILDYAKIKGNERGNAAVTQFKAKIAKAVDAEDKLRRRASVLEADEELQQVYKDAFADGLDGIEVWESMIDSDPIGKALNQIDGVKELQDPLRDLMVGIHKELFGKSIRSYVARKQESEAYHRAIKDTKTEVIQHGRYLTEEFEGYSHKVFVEKIRPIMSQLEVREKLNGGPFKEFVPPEYLQLQEHLTPIVQAYVKKLHKLWYCLVSAEVELNDQITEVGRYFQTELRQITENWMDEISEAFVRIRSIPTQFHSEILQLLFKFSTEGEDQFEEDMILRSNNLPQQVQSMISESDSLYQLLKNSLDNQLNFLKAKEDELMKKLTIWLEKTLTDVITDEVDRYRRRIAEISHFVDFFYEKLKGQRVIQHCTSYIPPVRDDQINIPTKEELRARRQLRANGKNTRPVPELSMK